MSLLLAISLVMVVLSIAMFSICFIEHEGGNTAGSVYFGILGFVGIACIMLLGLSSEGFFS